MQCAIETNFFDVVKRLIEGRTCSVDDVFEIGHKIHAEGAHGELDEGVDKNVFMSSRSPGTVARVPPIFLAVQNCYYHAKYCRSRYSETGYKAWTNALGILDLLLNEGVDLEKKLPNVLVCNVEHLLWAASERQMTAAEFTLWLKQYTSGISGAEKRLGLDDVLERLHAKAAQPDCGLTVRVPAEAAALWKSLLFSSDFSDIKFATQGETIHAHKAVLAAGSPYFKTLFEGPWRENASDTVQTSASPKLLRTALRFIYTGETGHDMPDNPEEVGELFHLASGYELRTLAEKCEQSLVRSLSRETVRRVLELSDLVNSRSLKSACVEYVRKHAAQLLFDPRFSSLASEKPDLWRELQEAFGVPAAVASSSSGSASAGGVSNSGGGADGGEEAEAGNKRKAETETEQEGNGGSGGRGARGGGKRGRGGGEGGCLGLWKRGECCGWHCQH
eukprot:Cvel_19382.t1-p1 / transcript=Cvel_19382.t1 / gene=Cvel_19382 / organism=Chromera_velia_CCMP2878 / gene_product=Speckle-type POZ protein, putative / transcript_product=Speckle-type POZ protein, putative / location=Cvel_scaffold1666:38505-39842(+) / protein_length=446 / sequence_SO=supercontig / SO=protein_coding / is_pseudo=false